MRVSCDIVKVVFFGKIESSDVMRIIEQPSGMHVLSSPFAERPVRCVCVYVCVCRSRSMAAQ